VILPISGQYWRGFYEDLRFYIAATGCYPHCARFYLWWAQNGTAKLQNAKSPSQESRFLLVSDWRTCFEHLNVTGFDQWSDSRGSKMISSWTAREGFCFAHTTGFHWGFQSSENPDGSGWGKERN